METIKKSDSSNSLVQSTKKPVNTVLTKTLLVDAHPSADGNKVGIFLLLYDTRDAVTGQANVMKYIRRDKVLRGVDKNGKDMYETQISEPIISCWLSREDVPNYILTSKFGTEILVALSGSSGFTRIEKFLSPEETAMYFKLIGQAN